MNSNPVLLETDWQSSTPNSSLVSGFSFLHLPLRKVFGITNRTEMAAGEHRTTHDVEQTEKMIPLITK